MQVKDLLKNYSISGIKTIIHKYDWLNEEDKEITLSGLELEKAMKDPGHNKWLFAEVESWGIEVDKYVYLLIFI